MTTHSYPELNTPISHKQAALLASHTSDPTQKSDLERLSQEDVYATVVLFKRTSIIDMLGDFHACNLAFVAYIDMLQHLKPRQYSVSSSFLAATGGEIIKITHDVLNTVSLSKLHPRIPWRGLSSPFRTLRRRQHPMPHTHKLPLFSLS